MNVSTLRLVDFRCYPDTAVELGEGLTVVAGPNGAGKTNLLEGLYFGCTGRSCRTANERELIRFGASATRVVVSGSDDDGAHELSVGFAPGQPKRMRADGAVVERLLSAPARPLVSVFLPDRLELVKGAPSLRRAHLDQFVAALWPSRAATRRAYAQTLAQRNALLGRIRHGGSAGASLAAWDQKLAREATALMADRDRAVSLLREPFARFCSELGIGPDGWVEYRPRSRTKDADAFAAELAARTDADVERGFTGHGPHRDDVSILSGGREQRVYGSQGQQRISLLALLLAEREAIEQARSSSTLMLLDDVMSELDFDRRESLVSLLRERGGQVVLTTTDLEHVPEADRPDVARVFVRAGQIRQTAPAESDAAVFS